MNMIFILKLIVQVFYYVNVFKYKLFLIKTNFIFNLCKTLF